MVVIILCPCEGDCALCAIRMEKLGLDAPPDNWECDNPLFMPSPEDEDD